MIKIYVKDSERVNDEKSAFVQFRYDPEAVKKIKTLPERYWNMETKMWEIPLSQIEPFQALLPQERFEVEEVRYDKKIPDGFSFKKKPMPHQVEAIEYGLNHPGFLNGDQQGLGKTFEALMTAEIRRQQEGLEHIMILCGVNSLRQNWKREIQRFTGQDACIIGERITRNGTIKAPSTADKLEDLKKIEQLPVYLILNVEALRAQEITDLLSDLCVRQINMIIFDEMHKCKSPVSQSGKALLRLNPKYKLALSGTPLLNDPMDLYLFMRWIGVEQRTFWKFKEHHEIRKEIRLRQLDEEGRHIRRMIPVGFKNLDEVRRKMDHFMIRRLKEDVLDLPEKVYTTEYLEMETKQRKIYEEIYKGLLDDVDKIKQSPNPLTSFIRLRQATADTSLVSTKVSESVKLDRMEDIVAETVGNGEKIIIFSYYHEVAVNALKRLERYHPAQILQETKDPEAQKERFRTETDVLVGTIGVMGTGHTLTEATTVLFLDQPWTSGDLEQAEDRAHRIGQTRPVHYITLVCRDTVDERVNEIVATKKDLSDMLIDNRRQLSVEFLLSRQP